MGRYQQELRAPLRGLLDQLVYLLGQDFEQKIYVKIMVMMAKIMAMMAKVWQSMANVWQKYGKCMAK